METSKPLAMESFSYSWLPDKRPSLDHPLDAYYHEEQDECFNKASHSFDFDVSVSNSASPFIHADELFSNGIIRSTSSANLSKAGISTRIEPILPVPTDHPSVHSSTRPVSLFKCKIFQAWRWKRITSKRVLSVCLRCIKKLCHKEGYMRKSIRVDDIDRRVREVRSWHGTPMATSPSNSIASNTVGGWSDVESSIYEAVLHCKRSIEACQ